MLAACLTGLGQINTAPVPYNPLELARGAVDAASTSGGRQAALDLLAQARQHYAVRGGGTGYDLKVSFVVNSADQI